MLSVEAVDEFRRLTDEAAVQYGVRLILSTPVCTQLLVWQTNSSNALSCIKAVEAFRVVRTVSPELLFTFAGIRIAIPLFSLRPDARLELRFSRKYRELTIPTALLRPPQPFVSRRPSRQQTARAARPSPT